MKTFNHFFKGLLPLLVYGLTVVPASAQDIKIGYVNAAKIIETAPQGASALQQLEKEFGPRDKDLKNLRAQIQSMEEDMDKNALVMKESDRTSKQRELLELTRKLKRSQQETREDYNLRRNEELGKLQRIVKEAIVEIAKSEGYDLILEQSVYVSKRVDITEKVLKKLGGK